MKKIQCFGTSVDIVSIPDSQYCLLQLTFPVKRMKNVNIANKCMRVRSYLEIEGFISVNSVVKFLCRDCNGGYLVPPVHTINGGVLSE